MWVGLNFMTKTDGALHLVTCAYNDFTPSYTPDYITFILTYASMWALLLILLLGTLDNSMNKPLYYNYMPCMYVCIYCTSVLYIHDMCMYVFIYYASVLYIHDLCMSLSLLNSFNHFYS